LNNVSDSEKGETKSKGEPETPVIAAPGVENQSPEASKDEAKPGKANGNQHRLLDIVAIVIAVFAFCAAAWQGLVARDTERRSLRAYMILTELGVFCPDCGDTALAPNTLTGTRNSIRFRIENSGQTPAYDVSTVTNWVPVYDVGESVRIPADYSFADHPFNSDYFASKSDIGRDHHKDVAGPIPDKDIVVFKDAIAKKFTLFIYGHVDYCDVFKQPHSTAFCFKYVQNEGTHLPICDRYDGEIPPKVSCQNTDAK
jgi:hypothetical protein